LAGKCFVRNFQATGIIEGIFSKSSRKGGSGYYRYDSLL